MLRVASRHRKVGRVSENVHGAAGPFSPQRFLVRNVIRGQDDRSAFGGFSAEEPQNLLQVRGRKRSVDELLKGFFKRIQPRPTHAVRFPVHERACRLAGKLLAQGVPESVRQGVDLFRNGGPFVGCFKAAAPASDPGRQVFQFDVVSLAQKVLRKIDSHPTREPDSLEVVIERRRQRAKESLPALGGQFRRDSRSDKPGVGGDLDSRRSLPQERRDALFLLALDACERCTYEEEKHAHVVTAEANRASLYRRSE